MNFHLNQVYFISIYTKFALSKTGENPLASEMKYLLSLDKNSVGDKRIRFKNSKQKFIEIHSTKIESSKTGSVIPCLFFVQDATQKNMLIQKFRAQPTIGTKIIAFIRCHTQQS